MFFLFEIPSLLSEWRKTRVRSLRVRYERSNLIVGYVIFLWDCLCLVVTVVYVLWFSTHFILILRIKYSNWRGGLGCVFSLWDSFAALGMTKDKGKVIASEVRVKQSYCWMCYLLWDCFVPRSDGLDWVFSFLRFLLLTLLGQHRSYGLFC